MTIAYLRKIAEAARDADWSPESWGRPVVIGEDTPRARHIMAWRPTRALAALAAIEALPPPEKLELLAEWIDAKYPEDAQPEMQRDLRRWATVIRHALAALGRETISSTSTSPPSTPTIRG